MPIGKLAAAIMVALLLTSTAAAVASADGRDLASKLGIRRLLQDDCIPPVNPGHGHDWCMPRNPDDIPKYFPWQSP
ncbi:hypothetical protein ACP70R_014991 [Stipagrostis hirtigluma subsp. patula]